MINRQRLVAQIAATEMEMRQAMETFHRADGALKALRWMLADLDSQAAAQAKAADAPADVPADAPAVLPMPASVG